jgi:integrase
MRHFPIAQCVNEHLLKWLTEDRPFVQSSYLFPGQYANTHMTPDNIARLFKRMATAAGIPDERAHTHVARHTVGFMLAERGNSMEYIAKFLGHASPKTTEAICIGSRPWMQVTAQQGCNS